jgi:3-oxoacyl-[acyl-carrier protein] reductase
MSGHRRVALITGGASGIGRMIAQLLARAGMDIAITVRQPGEHLDAWCDTVRAYGGRVAVVPATDEGEALVSAVCGCLGSIDVLINNAGPFVRERTPFAEYDKTTIDMLMHTNALVPMHLDRLVIPMMREKRWGRIVHLGFAHAAEARGWTDRAAYAAAKCALVSLTKSLADEEARHGITVNMVCPGDIRDAYKHMRIDDVRGHEDVRNPGVRPGTGEDIARVVAFLCDEHSDYVTGAVIDVHGGYDPMLR